LPHLQQFYAKLGSDGVAVVAVDVTSDDEGARRFFKEKGLTFPTLRGSWEMAGSLYGVTSTPTSVMIDRRGRVIFRHTGFGGDAGLALLESEARALLRSE
jgi:peroxiredoxin